MPLPRPSATLSRRERDLGGGVGAASFSSRAFSLREKVREARMRGVSLERERGAWPAGGAPTNHRPLAHARGDRSFDTSSHFVTGSFGRSGCRVGTIGRGERIGFGTFFTRGLRISFSSQTANVSDAAPITKAKRRIRKAR